mgnify:CR=1 FL=1
MKSGQHAADSVGGATQQAQPTLVVGNQYVRSVSLNVANTPHVFSLVTAAPNVRLVVDVSARQLADNQPDFEVTLVIHAHGHLAPSTGDAAAPVGVYEASVAYAGLLRVPPGAQDNLEALLLIEAPRLIFPAARSLLLTLVREAGFPVANIQPVDFVALWQARRAGA